MNVKEVKKFSQFKPLYLKYLANYNLTEERKKFYLNETRKELLKPDNILLICFHEKEAIGFAICGIFPNHIQVNVLFALEDYKKNCYFTLFTYGAKKAEELGKKMFQVFHIGELEWKQELERLGFKAPIRVRLERNLAKKIKTDYKLPKGYSLAKLSENRLDEALMVVVKSLIRINSDFFIQFRDFDVIKHFFEKDVLEGNQLRDDSLIITHENRIIGVILLKSFGNDLAHVWDLVVLPDHRQKGMGHYLLQEAIRCCQKTKTKQLSYDVQKENDVGHQLAIKHGFEEALQFLGVIREFEN